MTARSARRVKVRLAAFILFFLKENIGENFLGSSIIQLSQKEPLFLPDNSQSLRNRVITISSNEKVSKYALKILFIMPSILTIHTSRILQTINSF